MKELISKLILKEEIEFKGSIEALKIKLTEPKMQKFHVKWISNNEFKFLSKVSFGTVHLASIEGIKGYGKIDETKDPKKIKIQLRTKLRIEIYFLTMVFILHFIGSFFMEEIVPFWIYFLFPIGLIYLWNVYRNQENTLFKNVKQYIKY